MPSVLTVYKYFSLYFSSIFGVGASSFHSPRSPALCFFYVYSFLFLITSRHFSFSLPIFRCPLTSIFYDLITIHLHQSFFPHDLIISVSLLLCLTYVCHTCLCSYFFIPDLLNPRYSHHPCQHSHFCYS